MSELVQRVELKKPRRSTRGTALVGPEKDSARYPTLDGELPDLPPVAHSNGWGTVPGAGTR